jgi:hypothetical protein
MKIIGWRCLKAECRTEYRGLTYRIEQEEEKTCVTKTYVKYIKGRSHEEEWYADDTLHVWTKRQMYEPTVCQSVRTFFMLCHH